MATTQITKIESSPNRSVQYAIKDKVGMIKDDISEAIKYSVTDKTDNEVVYYTLSSYWNCTEKTALEFFHSSMKKGRGKLRMEAPRTKSGKEVVAWHLIQNFDTDDRIPPHVANEIGLKLAKEYLKDYVCVVGTHTNTDNIHNHIVFCAWDKDGRKYHDCHATKREIRKISDRLCEEYGLSVLVKTQDMKLTKHIDRNGVTRYFEPTDRKIDLIRKREKTEAVIGDVNDYRNRNGFNDDYEEIKSNRSVIQDDIDNILPTVRSYEELLKRLRDLGYTINDKKKNGDWLKHISFKAPLQEGATRDYKLGDGVFYVRENLTKYIDERGIIQDNRLGDQVILEDTESKTFYDKYKYDPEDVQSIDDDSRRITVHENEYSVIKRNDLEKIVLRDVKIKDMEVKGLIDTSGIYRIIAEQECARREHKNYKPIKKEEELVLRIREGLENLRFIERNGIYGYEQIISLYKAVYDSYNRNLLQLVKIEQLISHFQEVLQTGDTASILEKKIQNGLDDEEYMFEEHNEDTIKLEYYKDIMYQYKIDTEEGRLALETKINEASKNLDSLKIRLAFYSKNIFEYERCIRVLDRIDTDNNRRNIEAISRFESVKDSGEVSKESVEDKRKERRGKTR